MFRSLHVGGYHLRIKIVALSPDQWPVYKQIRLEALEFEPRAFNTTHQSMALKPDGYWRDRLAADPPSALLFALDGATCVGMIGVHRDDDTGLLNVISMYVQPSARGRGVGRLLLDAALQSAAQVEGIGEVRLVVNETQEAAIGLYRKRGFQVIGQEELKRADGSRAIQLTMSLSL